MSEDGDGFDLDEEGSMGHSFLDDPEEEDEETEEDYEEEDGEAEIDLDDLRLIKNDISAVAQFCSRLQSQVQTLSDRITRLEKRDKAAPKKQKEFLRKMNAAQEAGKKE